MRLSLRKLAIACVCAAGALSAATGALAAGASSASGGSSSGAGSSAGGSFTPASLTCAPGKRAATLAHEQAAVLARLGPLTTLRSAADLKALAIEGWSTPTDQFASFRGIGMTISDPADALGPGAPNQLYYAPASAGGNPAQPSFPYVLKGWGYSVPYAPEHLPSFLPCIGLDDWFVQERGIDSLTTGQVTVMPPAEHAYGAGFGALSDPPALGPVVGFPHPRQWVVHLWQNTSGPASAIVDPNSPPGGLDPHVGANFYVPRVPPFSILAPYATAPPVYVPAAGGAPFSAGGGQYTFKTIAAYFTGNQMNVITATLPRGSTRVDSGRIGHDEGWYVQSGEIRFTDNGQTLDGTAGSFVYLPAGSDYSFTIPGATAHAVYVTASVPAGRTTTPAPFVLQPGEGQKLTVGTEPYIVKAGAQDTGGSFSAVDVTIKHGFEPLPHIHHLQIEIFYDLSGEMTFVAGGQTIPVTAGDTLQLPVGVPHFYTVDGNKPFHGLLFAVPGGLEQLFQVLSQAGTGTPPIKKLLPSQVEPILPNGKPPGGS